MFALFRIHSLTGKLKGSGQPFHEISIGITMRLAPSRRMESILPSRYGKHGWLMASPQGTPWAWDEHFRPLTFSHDIRSFGQTSQSPTATRDHQDSLSLHAAKTGDGITWNEARKAVE